LSNYKDLVDWLLERDNSMVRYNTLIYLLDRRLNDPDVEESLERMMVSPPIINILRKQNKDGVFLRDSYVKKYGLQFARFGYLPKYKATIWQAIFLAQTGVPKGNPHIKALGEYILENSYDKKNGFLFKGGVGACLNSNMIWALCKFGFEVRHEIRRAFNFQVHYQRFDDGAWIPPKEWPYSGKQGHCWGPLSCYIGITQFVRAMTVIPDSFWNKDALNAKERAIKFLVSHGVIRRKWVQKFSKSLPCYKPHRTEPNLKLQAPLTFGSDPIEVITNLLKSGVEDTEMDEAISYVLSKQNQRGRWVLERVPSSMYGRWGKVGTENKWITFRALRMLKLADKFHI